MQKAFNAMMNLTQEASQVKRLNIFEEDLYRELQKWKRRASP